MKRSTLFYAALILCLLSGLLAVMLIYQYARELQSREEQAKLTGLQQASIVQSQIDQAMQTQQVAVEAFAADLTSGALVYTALPARMREIEALGLDIYRVGAAFEPRRYNVRAELWGPFEVRNDEGNFDRKQLENFYNYTDPNDPANAWYHTTLQTGQPNWYVYNDRLAATILVKYAAPFFATDPATGQKIAVGVVYIDRTVDSLKAFIRSIDVGEEGYTTLVSAEGVYVVHPRIDLVNKTVRATASAEMIAEYQQAAGGAALDKTGVDPVTREAVWRFYRPLQAAGWYAAVVIKQNANSPSAEFTIRALLQIALAAMVFAFFLSALFARVERASLRRLWGFSVISALILLAGVTWTWTLVNGNPLRNVAENVLVNQSNVSALIDPIDSEKVRVGGAGAEVTRIPTGVLIKTVQVDPAGAVVSGYIWQKYPTDLPAEVTRGIRFPDDLSGATISEVYRFTSGKTETVGWFFIANVKQSFDLSKYPLDQANVKLKVWPRELDHNLVFVPDFVSYEFMAPSEKPGLADTLTMAGWTINRSYFSYVEETFNADLGSEAVLQRNTLPSLAFNINATRNLLSPLIAYCITAIVVASMLFGIQLVNIETPYNALSNASALFFVVAITHVGLRSSLNASGVVYLEYIFIILYIFILGGAVNGMLYYGSKGTGWIHYEHNLIPKIAYWPAMLSILLSITLGTFYPLQVPDATPAVSIPAATVTTPTPAAPTATAGAPIVIAPEDGTAQTIPEQEIVLTKDSVTLRYPIYANPTTLDPSLSTRFDSTEQIGSLFMGLTRLNPATREVEPALATVWTPSADGLTWTFQLRTDVPWVEFRPNDAGTGGSVSQVTDAQGQPRFVTAEDVVYGIQRSLTSGNTSAANLYFIKNAKEVFEKTRPPEDLGVRAVNASTVQFTLTGPAPFFYELLAYDVSYAVPSWAIAEWDKDWTAVGNINTNGPYLLGAFEANKRLQLIKNPFWPEAARVQIEVIEEPIVTAAQQVVTLYLNNELDAIDNPPDALLKTIKSNALVTPDLQAYPKMCTQYIGFVNTRPPFDNENVRRAFSAAIDRTYLTEQILRDGSMPAQVFSPPGVFGAVTDPAIGQGYDPALAKQLFDEYLRESSLTVKDFNSAYPLTFGQLSTGDAVNQAIVLKWKEVLGVEVELITAPNDDLSPFDRKNVPFEKAYYMFQGNWCADYPDQDNFIRGLFNAQSGSNNVRRNCADAFCAAANPPNKFDELTTAAATITDPETRKAYYAQAEQLLAVDEAAYAPLFFGAGLSVKKPWLTRNYPAFGAPDFFNWTIDTNAQVKP